MTAQYTPDYIVYCPACNTHDDWVHGSQFPYGCPECSERGYGDGSLPLSAVSAKYADRTLYMVPGNLDARVERQEWYPVRTEHVTNQWTQAKAWIVDNHYEILIFFALFLVLVTLSGVLDYVL